MKNFTHVANLFLPSYRHCSYDFMLKICGSQKKAFEKSEVARVAIRNYRELRMRAILKQVLPHPEIESYLPDKRREVYKVDEWYVLSIVNKVEPDWFGAIAQATFETRYKPKADIEKIGELQMPVKLKKALMDMPFQPSKFNFFS